MGFLHPDGPPWGSDPGAYEADAVERAVHAMRFMYGRYFRLDARGFEHVPVAPSMIVSNHSGGTSVPDSWGFVVEWYRHFGTARPIHPVAHEMVFSNRVTGEWMARRGVLRADRTLTRAVLRDWRRDVFVMPGGDCDTWRPYADRYQVRFGGRSGYARIALEEGIPIVPVAHAGAHETLVVLTSGRRIARAMGLPRWFRAEIFPIHLSLPWGLAIGPMPHMPTPALLRWRIGEPVLPPASLKPGDAVPDDLVAEVDATVRARMQAMLDDLAAERAVWSEWMTDRFQELADRLRRRFYAGS
jgi:1-acyl-sn-glycerol-3-phosphate acyltransferase